VTVGPTPERGDVVWLDFHPQAGHERSGRRPALVLSPETYNGRVGLAVMCPITTREKGYPFEVSIPEGFPVQGVVLVDQIRSLDWRARNASRICAVPKQVMEQVKRLLEALLP
jgi:mRNA interferase MazF